MKVSFKNPKTGESKQVKAGFSWVLLLFSGFLGLPLFLRKLHVWGGLFLVLWAINFLGPNLIGGLDGLAIIVPLFLIELGLSIWLGFKGNEMTAKNYLENGWEFAEPTAETTQAAKKSWGLA